MHTSNLISPTKKKNITLSNDFSKRVRCRVDTFIATLMIQKYKSFSECVAKKNVHDKKSENVWTQYSGKKLKLLLDTAK